MEPLTEQKQVPKTEQHENRKVRFPTRLGIGLMSFVACSASFMVRTNISITLLAMIQPAAQLNGTSVVLPDYGPRFAWTASEQSALLGSFHIGSAVSVLPLGMWVDRYGHVRELIGASFLLYGLMQFVSPVVAAHSVTALITIGILMGIAQSTVFSSAHKLITKWSPPSEIGRFTMYSLGTSVGTIVGWSISGLIIESAGWHWAYHANGAMLLVLTAVWWRLVYDTPAQHPRIGRAEREYIEGSLIGVSKSKSWPPMGRLLTSAPIWAIVLMQFGNLWGYFFIVTGAPKFLNEVLGFPIAKTGFLASMPYLMRAVGGFMFGMVADAMRSRWPDSMLGIRRMLCVCSHIIPGLIILALPFVADDTQPYLWICMLSIAFGFNGSVAQSVFANVHDVAPNYASTVLSLANAIGVASGFLSPVLVAYLTAERNTIDEWRLVFVVNAVMFLLPAMYFMCVVSVEALPWNEIREKATGGDEEEMVTIKLTEGEEAKQSKSDK